jgi:hypothetical protein
MKLRFTDTLIYRLWFLALSGGVGYGIDFYLGRTNQEKLRSWLETKWLQFHEVPRHRFSAEEAGYYVDITRNLVGDGILSKKSCGLRRY